MRKFIFIIGQTASGKKAVAHRCALETDAEIISVDSMKIYRGMQIGTAAPSREMRQEVVYHMIHEIEPVRDIDLKWYIDRVEQIIENDPAAKFILSGGSSMYVRGILSGVFNGPARDEGFRKKLKERAEKNGVPALHKELLSVDPEAGSRILENDRKRIIRALEVYHLTGKPISEFQGQFSSRRSDYEFVLIGLRYDRKVLYERINLRVDRMFEKGLVEEVKELYENDKFGRTSSKAIGYRQIIQALENNKDPASPEIRDNIKANTRQFARKQMTWFRKFKDINWIDVSPEETPGEVFNRLTPFLKIYE